ncbi:MAG: NADPH-dependent assimilatory sulfite reductase hemoprotein subunit [Gemmatimonadaceae bacterium]|nr:NADPH-dependent assimilatory sulfite reductase hemoprotein subunit [Acetobacteraceae bacterium]
MMSITTKARPAAPPSGAEALKLGSRGLRGTVAAEIAGHTRGGVSEAAYGLLKFHGTYEQFDRDTATVRKQAGLDKEWQFMVRVRASGGAMTAAQYLALDDIADRYANGTLKITSRQGIQFHGTVIGDLKAEIAAINRAALTTYAACGDVVRNVMTTPAPRRDAVHRRLQADAAMLSERLLPQSRGYYEIFLDEPGDDEAPAEHDPIYGTTFLPRKFKIGLVHAADNTVDVLANDLGFVAVFEGEVLQGYQVFVGGGQGMTHNNPNTFPRVASAVGFVGPDQLWEATTAVISLQRDHGDRTNRRRARLKYVVEDRGLAWVRHELMHTYGLGLQPVRDLPPFGMPELLGWHDQGDGRLWLGVPVGGGRIEGKLRMALREVVSQFGPNTVFTPQQDVLLTDVRPGDKAAIDAVLQAHGVATAGSLSPLGRWSLACTSLPFCGLALTEAERVRQPIVEEIEALLARHGMADERLSLRIAGCPNGCSRPYTGDLGLVGRMPGHYAVFVGGDFEGTRLSFKLREKVAVDAIGDTLGPLIAGWAAGRSAGEGFGDFCARVGLDGLLAMMPAEASDAG